MAGTNQNINYERLVSRLLEEALTEKHREVVTRRFGLGGSPRETLEEIGKGHNITRERVRQIEAAAFDNLRKEEYLDSLDGARGALKSYIDSEGFVVPEGRLLTDTASSKHHPSLLFVLSISPEFHFYPEGDRLHSSWTTNSEVYDNVKELLEGLHGQLADRGELTEEDTFYLLLTKEARSRGLDQHIKHASEDYLDIIKTIQKTPEGHYGLADWPEVTPKGVRDKSYIVLKKRGEPLHFRDISDLINATEFSELVLARRAYPQTVHNELIKDDRFVLVGRGTYALKEWGYEPGTVKEIIRGILGASSAPLTKEELVKRVSDQRFVKENTILLNLQDRTVFRRLPSGEFVLVD